MPPNPRHRVEQAAAGLDVLAAAVERNPRGVAVLCGLLARELQEAVASLPSVGDEIIGNLLDRRRVRSQ